MVKVVGLTGGIGSGKTTVANLFIDLGVPVYNSDTEAKMLMETSQEVKMSLIEVLGDRAYIGKSLNKRYISNQIFNNTSLLKAINDIVHPAVRSHFLDWAKNQHVVYVIQEAAIIFEMGSQDFYDRIILVTAPKQTRIKRIQQRNSNESTDEIKSRIRNQWSDARKIKLSDDIIENINLKTTEVEVLNLHRKLLKIFKMG